MTTEGPNISSHSGIRKWYINAERCFSFWGTSRIDCTQCIRVCPFNKRPGVIHDITRLLIRKWPALNPLFVRIDRWMGYTRPYPPERFWGDLS
ncbi:MAG: hypothetical protein JRJ01_09850, partial [Deltaproteobacteria bacterium]|nr:hypothetical protein [Deltaproteobacteria bacterium]